MPNSLGIQVGRILRYRWLVAAIVVLATLGALVALPAAAASYTGRALVSSSTLERKPDEDAIIAQAYTVYFNDPSFQGEFRRRAEIPSEIESFSAQFIPGAPMFFVLAVGPNKDTAAAAAGKLAQMFVDEVNLPLAEGRQKVIATMTKAVEDKWGDLRAREDPDAIKAMLNLQQRVDAVNGDQSNQLTLMQADSGAIETPKEGKLRVLASGAVGGFLLGCVVAMMLGAATRRLFTEYDIASKTGLKTLEVVPPPDQPEQRIVRLRHLANVIARSGGPRSSVAVTPVSAGAAAADLALAIAEQRAIQGARTVLVQADQPVAESDSALDHSDPDRSDPERNGYAEFLAGASEVSFTTAPGTAEDLRIVEPGRIDADPYFLFDRDRWRALVDHVGTDADLLVVESPPLATSAEAQVVNDVADHTLLVIEQGVTRVGEVAEAVKALEQVGAEVLGTVLVEQPDQQWSLRRWIDSRRGR